MAVPSREDPIESLCDLTTVEDEYNATVDSHVHAVVLTEVLGLLGDYMTNICKAYEESEMLLAERLTRFVSIKASSQACELTKYDSIHARHVELGGQPLVLPISACPEDAQARVLSKGTRRSLDQPCRSHLSVL